MPAKRRPLFIGLMMIGAVAIWLLFAGPANVLGVDTGNAGVLLLILVGWGALYLVSRIPDAGLVESMSRGEWRAWLGCAFAVVIGVYSLVHAPAFQGPPLTHNPDANHVGRNVVMMLVSWMIFARVLDQGWRGGVREDERDREIAARATGWARMTLVVLAIAMAVLLSFSPAERLAWAPPPMIGHLLIVGLIVSCVVEYVVTALSYWRDRH
jgi:drug/metabolite transporter (DMT)-like permease